MERKLNRLTRITAFALGIGLTAMQLSAEQGTFNLPVQAHWGNAVLQPGEHTLQVPLPLGQTIVYLRGGGAAQMAIPLTTENTADSNRSYLHLSKVGGEYYVDAYQSGVSGRRFIFAKPKATRSASSGAEGTEATLVSVAEN